MADNGKKKKNWREIHKSKWKFHGEKRHKSLLLLFVRQYILNFPIAASTYIRIRNIHRQIDRSKEIFNFQVVAVRGRFLSLTQLDRKLQKTRMAQHQKPRGGPTRDTWISGSGYTTHKWPYSHTHIHTLLVDTHRLHSQLVLTRIPIGNINRINL
jgi:hypothetical protein